MTKIGEPTEFLSVSLIGFDSAWADNPKQPGAICSLDFDHQGARRFNSPQSASFAQATEFVLRKAASFDKCIVAIDQPSIVANASGMRAVERVAATAVCFAGGGVQPANRAREKFFGDIAPIWNFKNKINANDDPSSAYHCDCVTLIEVYPALALLSLEPLFFGRNAGPKYNPAKSKKFRQSDWVRIVDVLISKSAGWRNEECVGWLSCQRISTPTKSDQDRVDSYICLLVLANWFLLEDFSTKVVGDVRTGYMLTPVSASVAARMTPKAAELGVAVKDCKSGAPRNFGFRPKESSVAEK